MLRIDRVTQVDESAVYHQGQGANSGLIINEQRSNSGKLPWLCDSLDSSRFVHCHTDFNGETKEQVRHKTLPLEHSQGGATLWVQTSFLLMFL